MRIVFMGTPDFAAIHLKKLIDNNFNIVGVFSQPDKPKGRGKKLLPTPVKIIAQENNIPVFQPKSVNVKSGFEALKKLNPDIIITVAYGKILKKNVINLPKLGCWNVHASLLPRYRGAAPIQRALENGETKTGISIFKIVEALDAGPIAYIKETPIYLEDNFESLYNRLAKIGSESLLEFLINFEKYTKKLIFQDDLKATYANKISVEDTYINWFESNEKVFNKIRAYDPIPGAKCLLNEQIIKLFDVSLGSIETDIPGKILNINKTGAEVSTGKGSIKIRKIQFPGKKAVNIIDAFNGRKIKIGDILKNIKRGE
ncbi:methionyl-tRNA formyltransferase [Marinitoga hydrogenitolerans DSM 16785]|uniref:Methionyl-tRNA formyltransferase n=1 Tax=Marinitoga hydrogenitolerans (strain DSM 16785 / JCM 12826 / AT1271) TaxID=1122195 RepID=A0A1M4XJ84_MARH1|nr:methionyl-tRNA formyltransferase [Marinitoga hydrogenitolerans]SHE93559.1 methionyl-tRNA formyltransferase [Marinitoga hydrogenitolerans DSM 16785]